LEPRRALFGESVECCPVLLGSDLEECLDFLRGVTSLSTTGGERPNEGVLIELTDLLGQNLLVGGALCHLSSVPPEALRRNNPAPDRHRRDRSRPAQPPVGAVLRDPGTDRGSSRSATAYSPSLPRRPTPNAVPRLTAVCSTVWTALPRSWIRSSKPKSAGIA